MRRAARPSGRAKSDVSAGCSVIKYQPLCHGRCLRGGAYPHGGARPFHRKSTCLTQLTLGPNLVHIWSRNPRMWQDCGHPCESNTSGNNNLLLLQQLRTFVMDPLEGPLWEGYHESRRCSRNTYPESYSTKYTSSKCVCVCDRQDCGHPCNTIHLRGGAYPHGGARTFHQRSTCLTQLSLGPNLVT